MEHVPRGSLSQQDKAPRHGAEMVQGWFKEHKSGKKTWPSNKIAQIVVCNGQSLQAPPQLTAPKGSAADVLMDVLTMWPLEQSGLFWEGKWDQHNTRQAKFWLQSLHFLSPVVCNTHTPPLPISLTVLSLPLLQLIPPCDQGGCQD